MTTNPVPRPPYQSFPTSVHPEPSGKPAVWGPSAESDHVPQNHAASGVEENAMTHPSIDEESMDEHPNWSDQEIPEDCRRNLISKTTRKQRKAVRKAHRGLGHPSREVFVKMLRLAGAHQNAIEYARKWVCPVCAASQMPKAQGTACRHDSPGTRWFQ